MKRSALLVMLAVAGLTSGFRCPGEEPTELRAVGGAGGQGQGEGGASSVGGGVTVASTTATSSGSVTATSTAGTGGSPSATPCQLACDDTFCGDCLAQCPPLLSACPEISPTEAVDCLETADCNPVGAQKCAFQLCDARVSCDAMCDQLELTYSSAGCQVSFNPTQCRIECEDAVASCINSQLFEVEICASDVTCSGMTQCFAQCLSGKPPPSEWGH